MEIIVPLKNIDALEKDTVTFTCELSKSDRKDGKWKFLADIVKSNEKFTITTDGVSQSLTIANITLKDQGDVSYHIENVKTAAFLIVDGEALINSFYTLWTTVGFLP